MLSHDLAYSTWWSHLMNSETLFNFQLLLPVNQTTCLAVVPFMNCAFFHVFYFQYLSLFVQNPYSHFPHPQWPRVGRRYVQQEPTMFSSSVIILWPIGSHQEMSFHLKDLINLRIICLNRNQGYVTDLFRNLKPMLYEEIALNWIF